MNLMALRLTTMPGVSRRMSSSIERVSAPIRKPISAIAARMSWGCYPVLRVTSGPTRLKDL